ncbi:hypothetical protein D3C73_1113900 [compost metagenome]
MGRCPVRQDLRKPQPGAGRTLGRIARCRRSRCRARRTSRANRFRQPGLARLDRHRARQTAATPGRPDRRKQGTTGAAGKPRQRQADPRNPRSGRLSAGVLPLHRRPGGQARRRHPAAGQAGPVCLHRARSHGCGCRDHSVEQPAVPDRDQTRPGARRGQYHRDQAVGTRLGNDS